MSPTTIAKRAKVEMRLRGSTRVGRRDGRGSTNTTMFGKRRIRNEKRLWAKMIGCEDDWFVAVGGLQTAKLKLERRLAPAVEEQSMF